MSRRELTQPEGCPAIQGVHGAVSMWDWLVRFAERAHKARDPERITLLELVADARDLFEPDPDRALVLVAQARALAQSLGETHWVLFCDCLRCEVLLSYKRDSKLALDIAVRNEVEARKSVYEDFAWRIMVHMHLIAAYMVVDPLGYADAIRASFDHLENLSTLDPDWQSLIYSGRAQFALALDQLDSVTDTALLLLATSESTGLNRSYNQCVAYALLCCVAHQRKQWEALLGYAQAGEIPARHSGESALFLVLFLAWQALAQRAMGDEKAAQRFYRQATARASHLKATFSYIYYDALCGYHEAGGELAQALLLRERELTGIFGGGSDYEEWRCRRERCRLLAQLGRPLDKELAAAREAAGKLVNPQPYLDKLERVTGG